MGTPTRRPPCLRSYLRKGFAYQTAPFSGAASSRERRNLGVGRTQTRRELHDLSATRC